MTALRAYRALLSNGPLVRLLGGEFVSSIGDWLYLVALLIVVYQESADPLILGIVGAARVLPYVLLSIPAGIVADRFERRLVLLVTDVARGLIMLAMAVLVAGDGPLWAIVALAILATCFSCFFGPTIGAYLPSLVRDERELGPANSAWSTLDNLAFVIGPAVGGLLIAASGLSLAFLLNAISFARRRRGPVATAAGAAAASPPAPVVATTRRRARRRAAAGGRVERGWPADRSAGTLRPLRGAGPHRRRRRLRLRRAGGPDRDHRRRPARRERGGDRLPQRGGRGGRRRRRARGSAGSSSDPRSGSPCVVGAVGLAVGVAALGTDDRARPGPRGDGGRGRRAAS